MGIIVAYFFFRTIAFHPDGDCLYAGSPDILKVYGWEPARTFDTVAMGWGKIQDIAIAQNQLVSIYAFFVVIIVIVT